MAQLKYVADGFLTDATKLLQDFSERNNLAFSVFSELWCQRNFSFIYAKRESFKELSEFTHEIFMLTGEFLSSGSWSKQVGGIYLLYALYRNQILDPPIRIRLSITKFMIFKSIHFKASAEKLLTLHYVLDYLFENAFELVAFPTLKGPSVRRIGKRFKQNSEYPLQLKSVSNLAEIKQTGLLEDLQQTFARYAVLRPDGDWSEASIKCQEFIGGLGRLLNVSSPTCPRNSNVKIVPESVTSNTNDSRIGSRRSQLKTAQFSRAIEPYLEMPVDCELNQESAKLIETNIVLNQKEQPQKNSRRKKTDSNNEELDDDVVELVKRKLPKPTKARPHEKAPRIRRYYKDGPSNDQEGQCLDDDLWARESEDELLSSPTKNISNNNFLSRDHNNAAPIATDMHIEASSHNRESAMDTDCSDDEDDLVSYDEPLDLTF